MATLRSKSIPLPVSSSHSIVLCGRSLSCFVAAQWSSVATHEHCKGMLGAWSFVLINIIRGTGPPTTMKSGAAPRAAVVHDDDDPFGSDPSSDRRSSGNDAVDGPARSAGGGMRVCCKWRLSCTHSLCACRLVRQTVLEPPHARHMRNPFPQSVEVANKVEWAASLFECLEPIQGLPKEVLPGKCASVLLASSTRSHIRTCTQHTSQVHRLWLCTSCLVNSLTHALNTLRKYIDSLTRS